MLEREQIKNLIYDTQNEFSNEIDNYESESGKELTDTDFEIMEEYLSCFCNKLYAYIDSGDYEEEETPLHKALVDEINMILDSYEDYENVSLNEEEISDIAWDIINYEENCWEELNNTICKYIRTKLVENYVNKKKESEE
jgi:hypothetical protein